ncbi:hypothetical protein CAL14_08340 [Bordetella genomosp. 9]|uniref:pentapeptide repeat-containing protein n=1 Tax=Bordetella genomosp. 9 TaxID=1416803 RepID=UPI000A294981|nr:pentapeptide repeat-containing protein [Bordetella genomosp. 9]ARP90292.1 hypothetical protein CAL14_08340 [Bordetella genomosp. 9]
MPAIHIRNRYTNEIIYTAEVPEGTESGLHTRIALEQAVEGRKDLRGANLRGAYLDGANLDGANLDGANLGGAYLRGANLDGANLDGAYLRGANLDGAYLRGANLGGTNLDGAYLRGANLGGAYLDGANLDGAYLRGAYLRDDLLLIGDRPVLTIGPIGSVGRTIFAWVTDKGLRIEAGCFFGTRDEFVAILADTHGGNEHAREYTAALALIDAHVDIWTPVAEAA